MFWKSCAHTAEQAKCQREHLIRELTFPAASSLEGAVDRQETQQREKNPHVCARISPHRVLTPSPGVCTPEHRMAAGPTFRTNYQSCPPPPALDHRRPVSPASSVRGTRYCEIPTLLPFAEPVTQRKSSSALN